MTNPGLQRYAWLSVMAAVMTILLKSWAWQLTGSVSLLSDALESFVNLAGAGMTLWMLTIAARPEDEGHPHGHGKAEYFASLFEGVLILLAALIIAHAAIGRLWRPLPLTRIDTGVVLSLLATLINFGVARVLLVAGTRHRSIALTADAHHLMTDVWTTLGVAAGLVAVFMTGWLWVDTLMAVLVAAHIAWVGMQLLRRSFAGLMDTALSPEDCERIERALTPFRASGIAFHAMRTREAGRRVFVSLHVLVPGDWTVQAGHDKIEEIEAAIRGLFPQVNVLTHMEPADDPVSDRDRMLDRPD
jgi:cation diffusion facilitator family transporter